MRHALVILFVLLGFPGPRSARSLQPPGSEVALLRSSNGSPVVEVRAGEEVLRLAVDTGSARTVLSAATAARLRLAPQKALAVAWVGGTVRTGLCALGPELRVGEFVLAVPCLGWVPGEQRPAGFAGVDGVLGADALASADLLIDAPRGRVRFAPTGSLAPWVEGTALRLETLGRRPALRVELPALRAAPALLVLDSGATAVVLFGDLARRAWAASPTGRRWAVCAAAARSCRCVWCRWARCRLGRLRLGAGTAGLLAGPGATGEDGLLPLRLLGAVRLDLAGSVLVVEASLRPAPRVSPELRQTVVAAASP